MGDGRKTEEKQVRGREKKSEGKGTMRQVYHREGNESAREHEAHSGYRERPALLWTKPSPDPAPGADVSQGPGWERLPSAGQVMLHQLKE